MASWPHEMAARGLAPWAEELEASSAQAMRCHVLEKGEASSSLLLLSSLRRRLTVPRHVPDLSSPARFEQSLQRRKEKHGSEYRSSVQSTLNTKTGF